MIIFPFIEQIAEWEKKHGGYLFWIWVITSSLILAVAVIVRIEYSFDEARWLLCLFLVVFFGLSYPVCCHERKRKQN